MPGCPLWQHCRGDEQTAQAETVSPETAIVQAAGTDAVVLPVKAGPTGALSTATEPVVAAAKVKSSKTKKTKTPKPDAFRQVFISKYRDWQRSAILYINTSAFKLDMKFRSTIECIIAGLVRYNGARHVNGYGLRNADFQVRMAALAFNLKRWAVLSKAKEKRHRSAEPDSS
jgi:hypothetical protein